MTQLEKSLKIACIACMFIGVVAIVVGVVTALQTLLDIDAAATIASGIGSAPAGAQSARLANVPSNAKKVRLIALIVLVATAVFAGIAYYLGNPTTIQLGAFALIALAAILMFVQSSRLQKELERV